MIIREATVADVPALLEIYNDVIVTTTAVYDYSPHTIEMRMQWFEEKQREDFPVFVAVIDDRIAGFSTFGPFRRPWTAYQYSVENSVYVDADFRGRGIAHSLMLPVIDAARKMDMHTILAGIDADNAASIRLHERLGFEKVAVMKQVGYKFGRWLDLCFMQLLLDGPASPKEEKRILLPRKG